MTYGRLWPILTGERGEYDLATHNAFGAEAQLVAVNCSANTGHLLPEQVWDDQPPTGVPMLARNFGTLSYPVGLDARPVHSARFRHHCWAPA
jgi:hypothetical protein